jgi:dTDP-4-amino-4,6-dideoxygalactose transaminase
MPQPPLLGQEGQSLLQQVSFPGEEILLSTDPIPLLDLKAQYAFLRDEIREALDRVLNSQQFILGPEVEAFEREVADYCQCAHAVGVSSGTDALLVVLMALKVQPGDEVIVPAFSFFGTAGVVARLGARPVFVDIDAGTFNIEPRSLEGKITGKTKAIVPVHLFGQMADMGPIGEIAARHQLPVIEDAAQAIGAELEGRRAGSIGLAGCLSFFPSKNLGGFGDGGMVVTNEAALADRVRMLRMHGFRTKYENELLGGNFRLDAIQAAVLRVKLRYLDRWTEARQRNAALYRQVLPAGVGLPVENPGRHIYNQFVIRHPRRDALREHLRQQQIGCDVYYPSPLHLQACFASLGHRSGEFPVSEKACSEVLALPIYPELTPEMIQRVANAIGTV